PIIEILVFEKSPGLSAGELKNIELVSGIHLPESLFNFYRELSGLRIEWALRENKLGDLTPGDLTGMHSVYSIRGNIDILTPPVFLNDFMGRKWDYWEMQQVNEKYVGDGESNAAFHPFDMSSGNELHVGIINGLVVPDENLYINDLAYNKVTPLQKNCFSYFEILERTMGFRGWPLFYSSPGTPEVETAKHYLKELFG
ncbi:MAG: hypothetical protein M3R17_12020, partial [Bacteroidota bacterium]|nr:hypothetical protein [Bacteroidota bacterium]